MNVTTSIALYVKTYTEGKNWPHPPISPSETDMVCKQFELAEGCVFNTRSLLVWLLAFCLR